MPRSSKLGQRTAVVDQFALTLHDMQRHRGLTVPVGGEFLSPRDRYRGVTRNDFLDEPAHGLEPERQRNHIEQQQIAVGFVAGEHIGLQCRTDGHHFVGIDIGEYFLAEKRTDSLAHQRHPGGTAHHYDRLDIVAIDIGIAQHLAAGAECALHQWQNQGLEGIAIDLSRVAYAGFVRPAV